jgi:dGTPase
VPPTLASPVVPAAVARAACHPGESRGRRVPEPASPGRDAHQRDRDRVVHSNAFRRLVYKTQVFLNHEGDLFRTRLTHSLEVAQLSRSIARRLGLNEDLVEAIALAHDLGHTPFGHAGQDALHACLHAHGGFEHNLQSLRVVDSLEQRYAAFDGLNLGFEAREGVLKHCSRRHAERLCAREPEGPAARFLAGTQPGLEAQLVNLADAMAYGAHDLDDGVRSGLLPIERLREVPLVAAAEDEALAAHPALADQPRRRLHETLRRLLAAQVEDLVANTVAAVSQAAPADAEAVRRLPASAPLVRFSPSMEAGLAVLRRFLFSSLYRHPRVTGTTDAARQVVAELFEACVASPAEWPAEHQPPARALSRERAAADWIAGMTDRFALREHRRITGRVLFEAGPEGVPG